jgi:hypothetical protein
MVPVSLEVEAAHLKRTLIKQKWQKRETRRSGRTSQRRKAAPRKVSKRISLRLELKNRNQIRRDKKHLVSVSVILYLFI